MSTETTATTDVVETDPVAEALAGQKAAVIDRAVREARHKGWCDEFERVLTQVFPDGSGQPRGEWYDSEGLTCRGFDHEGYRNGFNDRGWDREGFNADGYDAAGYNRQKVNRAGFNAEGIHAATGKTMAEFLGEFKYDRNGRDVNGWDRYGQNRDGYTLDHLLASGMYQYDAEGYNADGANRYGERRPAAS